MKELKFNVYARGWQINETVRLILIPKQGLETEYSLIVPDKFASNLVNENYYKVDVKEVNGKEKKYEVVGLPVLVERPTKEDIENTKEIIEKQIKQYQKEKETLEKEKKKEFAISKGLPEIPGGLVIDQEVWNLIISSVLLDQYSLLLGPKGCGKTHTAKAVAESLNYKFLSFNMGGVLKPKQTFVGVLHARETSTGVVETQLIESEFLKAFSSQDNIIIFLDEITRIPQQASNYLMTILDREQSYIYVEELGKRIYRGPNIRFICAGNIGTQYTDTRTLDGAFWDRFNKLTVDYMLPEEELELVLKRIPSAPQKEVKKLINIANKTREAEKTGALSSAISTRQILDMAKLLAFGNSLQSIIDKTLLNNFINGNVDEREQVKIIIQS
jgi:nitric oxide reductase NorQ protein